MKPFTILFPLATSLAVNAALPNALNELQRVSINTAQINAVKAATQETIQYIRQIVTNYDDQLLPLLGEFNGAAKSSLEANWQSFVGLTVNAIKDLEQIYTSL